MVLQQDIIVQLQVQGVPKRVVAGPESRQCSAGPRPVIGPALLLAGGGSWAGHWAPEAQQQSAGAVSI